MFPDRFPSTLARYEWANNLEKAMQNFANTTDTLTPELAYHRLITGQSGRMPQPEPLPLEPGQFLSSPTGYYYVLNISRKTGTVRLERCQMNLQAQLERRGRYRAVSGQEISAGSGWQIVPGKSDWIDRIATPRFTLVLCLVGGIGWSWLIWKAVHKLVDIWGNL